MKICPVCSQTYTDQQQNFCLNDGAMLNKISDDAPPTVRMDAPRVTDQKWRTSEPPALWENQQSVQTMPLMSPQTVHGADQTLPKVALSLGILSVVLICCYGGFPLNIAAMIVGYLGIKNVNKDSVQYGGKNLATIGLILGAISFCVTVVMIIAVVIGNIT